MATILLLGAEKSKTSGIESLLRQDRHTVYLLREVERWHTAATTREFDLIVTAIRASEPILTAGNGRAHGFPAPILIVQEDPNRPNAMRGDDRVVDRISIPFTAEDLLARVDALTRVRRIVRQLRADSLCNDRGSQKAEEQDGMFSHFANRVSSILNARITGFSRPPASYVGVATRVAAWADRRDAFEPGHSERVSAYAAMIADGIGLSRDETTTTVRAAKLHDIGKVALPLEILRQKTPLIGNQKRLLETHPERGASILQSLHADPSIVDAIRHHHVRFDRKGQGPQGVHNIPRSARVVAAAEVFDAMTSSQFRPALTKEAALEQMSGLRGGQLDPDCVDALVAALKPRPEKIRVAHRLR